MMKLLTLIILSAGAAATTDRAYDEAVEVYRCDFEQSADTNFDLWPDGWTRRRGRGYPLYLKVAIGPVPDAASGNCLHMELDGGAASVYSPPIEVRPMFSYLLKARLKTQGLKHDVTYCEVVLRDSQGAVLEAYRSAQFRDVPKWTEFQVGPITPAHPRARQATIAIHLRPTDRADLRGTVLFDDIEFGRLPRMSVDLGSQHNVFTTDQKEMPVTCRVSGFSEPDLVLQFELTDVTGRVLSTVHKQIQENQRTAATPSKVPHVKPARLPGYTGTATWSSSLNEPGFYRIRVSMPGYSSERTVSFALVRPAHRSTQGEFGWGFPPGGGPIPVRQLPALLREVGIHWAKIPVWYAPDDTHRAEELAWLAERLGTHQIQMVGVLDQPPPKLRESFGEKGDLPVASIFVEPRLWRPAIDPVMTRLNLKVRWWQLGSDTDTSFVNYPNLEQELTRIRRDLTRFGQEINMGIAWRAIEEAPSTPAPPWRFLSYTADPPLTAAELRAYLSAEKDNPADRWVVVHPLPKHMYDLDSRANDLVLRMLAAKIDGASGIFVSDPFHPEHGLMDREGMPTELLLVWRTTASMVSGLEHLGSITLPEGSKNHIFVNQDRAVMVVWNDEPVVETVYLGEEIQQVDLWGRRLSHQNDQDRSRTRQQINVGRLPTFITGVNPHIARWRRDFQFDTRQLASVFGRKQRVRYHFRNSFDQGVSGDVILHTPIVRQAQLTEAKFKLSAGDTQQISFAVALGVDVNSGPQPVRADFKILADRRYRFSVYRTIQVGLGNVVVKLSSRLDEAGNLVVEQVTTNKTDELVSFNCLLMAPGRKRTRQSVFNLGRGSTTNTFVFPNGEDLIGKQLWMRAEEIGGARVLNHHIQAER